MTASVDEVANKFFDYIICGGGTAGLTLAARLSEDPHVSVLLLEAGEANLNDPAILRPASYGSHFASASYAWAHQTKKCGDTQHFWHRGKGLGGSSGINFMVWSKPPAQDINDFEKLGNPGWNWENYERYLARTEGFMAPNSDTQKEKNLNVDTWKIGRNGPLKITFPATIDPGEFKVQQTFLNAGLSAAPSPMSGNPQGVFLAPNTYDPETHTRSYASTAFYLPASTRPNLTVLVSAHVHLVPTQVTGNGQLTAIGVEFDVAGKVYMANAIREVILSAGTLKSPQILELSGIGDKSVLRKMGVRTKVDLPGVGENVQEHILGAVNFELRDDVPYETLCILRDPAVAANHLELHANGSGMFTTGVTGFAFATLNQISGKAESIVRDAKENIMKNASSFPPGLLDQYQIQLGRLEKGSPGCEFINFPGLLMCPTPAEDGKRYLTILISMNHAFSRGSIHSTSSDPAKDPEFDPKYFDQSVDLDVWTEMFKFARSLGQVAPLKDMIVKEVSPGAEVTNDGQLREWVQGHFGTTWHTASSCSMLPRPNGGVVDHHLKVYGTNNVRVVDLSVVPLHFAAHSQATAYAIAEQAASIIKTNASL